MKYYNPHTNQFYRGGALKTAQGTIFNPTEETLKKHGYEPYTPPVVEPVKVEPSELRRQAYEAEVDPLVTRYISYHAEAEYAEEMADNNEETYGAYIALCDKFRDIANDILAEIARKKAEIRERYPDEVAQ